MAPPAKTSGYVASITEAIPPPAERPVTNTLRRSAANVAKGGYASASRLLPGRCKKDFEFESKTGKNLAGIRHRKHPILHRKISLCVATSRAPGMESRTEQVIFGVGRLLPGCA